MADVRGEERIMNYMKQLSELFGINERDVLLFMTMAFIGGFVIGVVTVTELLEAFSQS